ncbi:MAG TPA: BlaI/MecI/CopY family transcriptional regulator [Gemmatimonadaceae bacterium]|jgi:predicted transcriptional regulator|nr:BlaI/MecI/CopY family transcriptional regulator [Gemmatimonadaceae bacterium]
MARSISLTRRELDIMSVLWRLGSATVGQIRDDLSDDLAYPTVQTMLRVLEAKRYVRHEQDGRAFRFFPRIEPDDAGDGALKRLVSKVYQGSRELLMSRLIADEDISPEELRRMKRILQQRIEDAAK